MTNIDNDPKARKARFNTETSLQYSGKGAIWKTMSYEFVFICIRFGDLCDDFGVFERV